MKLNQKTRITQVNIVFIALVLFFIISCKPSEHKNETEWGKIFSDNKADGTFVLYNIASKEFKYFNKTRSDSEYIPASTFKILNSLIALESNVVENENEIIKWNGSDKGWSKWNKDQNMKSAILVSCVWFYQELARRIGQKEMKGWIDSVKYGNGKMGSKIDDFWLKGDLKISANQQVDIIRKLIRTELPFKLKNQQIVKRIMITDSTKNYVTHSKTGWGIIKNSQIGWFVGYIEKAENIWIFAMNIDIHKKSDLKKRKNITYDILKVEKIIE